MGIPFRFDQMISLPGVDRNSQYLSFIQEIALSGAPAPTLVPPLLPPSPPLSLPCSDGESRIPSPKSWRSSEGAIVHCKPAETVVECATPRSSFQRSKTSSSTCVCTRRDPGPRLGASRRDPITYSIKISRHHHSGAPEKSVEQPETKSCPIRVSHPSVAVSLSLLSHFSLSLSLSLSLVHSFFR